MRERSILAVSPILLATAVLVGCEDRNEFIPPPPPTVTVSVPLVQDVTRYLELPARLEAAESVEIRARVRGYLETMEFQPGTIVQAGDLLFTLEREAYEAALESARGRREQTKAALLLAETRLERVKDAAAQQAASELEVIEEEAQRDAAAGAVVEADAAVDVAALDLSYTEIRSPVTGRVDRELIDVGNLVGANEATLLTTVLSEKPIYAFFSVNERDLLQLLEGGRRDRPEQTTQVFLTLSNGRAYPEAGVIDFASNTVDVRTGTIEIRAIFENHDRVLIPGLFVRAKIPQSSGDSIVVPQHIVQRDVAGSFVLVVAGENIVERRGVTLGPLVEQGYVIDVGLEASDRIIVNGFQRARPGAPVSPQEATNAGQTAPEPAGTESDATDATQSGGEG